MGKDTAYFVRRPSTISDLRVPHLLSLEKEYDIVEAKYPVITGFLSQSVGIMQK
jgi:hypothetical protein